MFQVFLLIWIVYCRSSQLWTISNFFLVGRSRSSIRMKHPSYSTRFANSYFPHTWANAGLLAIAYQGINDLGARYYPDNETRSYFDQHGVFMGVFYAGPLIGQLLLLVCLLLWHVVSLLTSKAKQDVLRRNHQRTIKKND